MPGNRNVRAGNSFFILLRCSVIIYLISYIEEFVSYRRNREGFEEVVRWLERHSTESGWRKNSFYDAGVVRLEKLCMLTNDELIFLSGGYITQSSEFEDDLTELKRQMILKFWLKNSNLERKIDKFVDSGFNSLQNIASKLEYPDLENLLEFDSHGAKALWQRIKYLKRKSDIDFDSFPVEESVSLVVRFVSYLWTVIKSVAKLFLVIVFIAAIVLVVCTILLYIVIVRFFRNLNLQQVIQNLTNVRQSGVPVATTLQNIFQTNQTSNNPNPNPFMSSNNGTRSHSLWQSFMSIFSSGRRTDTGPPLPFNPMQTKFDFSWDENQAVVGEMRSFTVKFYSMFVIPCQCRNISGARAEITVNDDPVPVTMEETGQYSFLVKFTPTVAAAHKISFHANGRCIKTFYKHFLPGEVDPSKTSVSIKSSTMVLKPTIAAFITLDECDKFGNKCESSEETLSQYIFSVTELKDDCQEINPVIAVTHLIDKYVLMMTLIVPGCYKTKVTFQDTPIANNEFTIIVLTDKQWESMTAEITKPSLNVYYEAYLLPDNEEEKTRRVYIYLTPKQLLIKEFYWKIFSKRLHTMRVRTTLKLSVLPRNDTESGHPLMTINEPGKGQILIACKERNVLVASYSQLLLRKIGGSANFESKRDHLYSELRKTYERKSNQKATISVARGNILKDSMLATKSFSDSDWGKQFVISFLGEYGLDYGGPRREWFQILCDSLFKPENHYFCKSGKDDAQSLTHPNPFRPESHRKLKYYEFAGKIVGKMIIECAYGRPHYANARFSRAFLCQIIGLDVSWRHFESDDKELFKTKIEYILKNDPEDLELTFTEDLYDFKQNFIKTIDLKPYGSQINVTESNKLNYLHLIADYRLAKCVRDEIASFTKGLNSLVPENLLSIFDENELELLICGTEQLSPLDLMENFNQCAGGGHSFEKVLGWFRDIVYGFSQEEMARLLQFTTGSSQLPPGGFKELSPKFQINFYPGYNVLPTAHTCFNMLCLPDYSSKMEFQRLLLIALNEGSEGFGLV